MRSVSGEITTEYLKRLEDEKPFYEDLFILVPLIVKSLISGNNENEAIDFLIELDLIEDIKNHCSLTTYKKICQYLISISNFSAEITE